MKPKLVEIEWVDARSVNEQLSNDEIALRCVLVKRITVGYLYAKDREKIVVASTYDPPDHFDREGAADFDVIPRGWATKITVLSPSEEEKDQ